MVYRVERRAGREGKKIKASVVGLVCVFAVFALVDRRRVHAHKTEMGRIHPARMELVGRRDSLIESLLGPSSSRVCGWMDGWMDG